MANAPELTFHFLGDSAVLVRPASEPSRARELAAAWAVQWTADKLPGVTDIVPAFGVVGVHFDPSHVSTASGNSAMETVLAWLRENSRITETVESASPRTVEVPACYDGPDLPEVAERAGIDPQEAIRLHSEALYTVGAVGFAPGFAYLEGLPACLHTPRRATPRTHVPAGSLAIGGMFSGVYPQESPGGWNLIGRTSVRFFDRDREPPSLLQVGDRVRFKQVAADELPAIEPPIEATTNRGEKEHQPHSAFRVVSPGVLSSLRGLGTPGWQAVGVTPGGAMDARSLELANLMAGAPRDALALEATLVGPVLEATTSVTLAVAGALPAKLSTPARIQLAKGDRLDLRQLSGGSRCYVAVEGGFAGEEGLPLQAWDTLAVVNPPHAKGKSTRLNMAADLAAAHRDQETAELRVLAGPQADWLDASAARAMVEGEFQVSRQSNRMGLRCEGPVIRYENRELFSQPVAHGAIQLPPDGQPVILGADRQTLGGYPVVGCVITADLPALGQLAPGDAVRFVTVDLAEAERRRREADRTLALAATGIALHD